MTDHPYSASKMVASVEIGAQTAQGPAASATAAISGCGLINIGMHGFTCDIRPSLLPFLFIFWTELLLIDVSATKAVIIFILATGAMMLFTGTTQAYFISRGRLWESLARIPVALTLLPPSYWLDRVPPPYDSYPGVEVAL